MIGGMSTYPTLSLKAGREASTGFHHPWIFSGALVSVPETIPHGSLVYVADRNGTVLGTGTFSNTSSIAVRLLAFSKAVIDQAWVEKKISEAYDKRRLLHYGPSSDTTGYRLVFAEADELPGLIIDMYDNVAVLQISTAGMELLKPVIVAALQAVMKPKAIVERSDIEIRRQEGLELSTGVLAGTIDGPVSFKEHGLTFIADVMQGQKTGFFFDQKDTRSFITRYAAGKKVLNLFSYTGASTVAALKGGATHVHNIDMSEDALAFIPTQLEKNGLEASASTSEADDVFHWLGEESPQQYDMVLLDPPALVKARSQKEAGSKAYHFVNRAAMRLVKNGGIFITSSCSRYLSEEDLAFVLRRAAVQNKMKLSLLHVVRQAGDHPLSIYFPESLYLKSFVCQVSRA